MLSDADYSGNASGARRAKKRSSGESPGDGQTLRSSGRQITVRVKRTNNPPPGQSKRKATDTEEEDDQSEKKYRKCEKAGCSATYPVCFASASERCAKNGYTSRWYHLSCGEHFCNECFDHYYRSHKDGYETFAFWKKVWTSNGKSEPSLKAFMADQQLPFWVQCTRPDCRKWRQLTKEIQLTASLAETYRCGMKFNNIKSEGPDQCSQPEDLRVAEVTDSWWHSMLILPPLFKDSPASPFLAAYYPDCVGMSPAGSSSSVSLSELRADHCRAVQPQIPGLCPYFQPFYQPNECGKALCVRPDMMELDELYEFPEFSRDPTMYLALRNLILASWHKSCKEVLTSQKCAENIIVRGLVRVRCVQEMDRVLHFMTRKGLINTGVLAVKRPLLPEKYCSRNVIIIGAGASGLAAARQLQNFGTQVMVLEARERIGGRVWDDASLGVTVGRGAQIVNGCVNNPIGLMCEQIGIKMHKLGERCDLFQEGGQATDPAIDKRMDFHFNAILDVVSEWRKDKSQNQDTPLKGKDSSGSDDDVPLSKLVTKPHSEKKQSREKSPTVGSKAKAKSASDDSSDDEPLIKKKRVPALEKKPQKKGNTPIRSNGTSNKKADVNTDDSSDNEPLIKIAKAAKKPISVPPKKAARAKKKKASDDSDDEPLSKLVNKRERKALVTPSKIASQDTKSRRNVATKKVKYAESSSDGSDDEPLAEMKKKLTNVPKKNSTDKKTKPKLKDKPPKDSSSSDSSSDEDEDDVPLVNLISKRKKPVKITTKKTAVSRGSASRKRREPSDESSDDEPLINFVKKKSTGKQTNTKTKASAPKKRNTTPRKSRKTVASGSTSDSSDDEPLIKKVKHPQVTKNLRITLERCDGEDGGATLSSKKTSTDAPNPEKTSSNKSESSQESLEED